MGINLNDTLMFIDEFSTARPDLHLQLLFLRNLCRYLKMPILVSSTNSEAKNLIVRADSMTSGKDIDFETSWVKIITRMPLAQIKILALSVHFKDFSGNSRKLKEFLIENDKVIDLNAFSLSVFGLEESLMQVRSSFIKFFDFVLPLCFETLPGLARYSIFLFLLNIPRNDTSLSSIKMWECFCDSVFDSITARKANILNETDSLLASAHTLTFPCELRRCSEFGGVCAKNVNKHFFKFGTSTDEIFDLMLHRKIVANDLSKCIKNQKFFCKIEQNFIQRKESIKYVKLENNGFKTTIQKENSEFSLRRRNSIIEFEDCCYFPSAREDILLNIGARTCLVLGRSRITVAALYKIFLDRAIKFSVNAKSIIQDSFPFEILALWAISSSSHGSCLGDCSGSEVLYKFISNVQCYESVTGIDENSGKSLRFDYESNEIPKSLSSFLDKVKFPYLINDFNANTEFFNNFRPYCEFGESSLCNYNEGVDVKFDVIVSSIRKTGLIECKYLADPIGLSIIFEYYKRSCEKSSPISFILCRKIQDQLKNEASYQIFDKEKIELKKHMQAQKVMKKVKIPKVMKKAKKENVQFLELWEQDLNQNSTKNSINMYAISLKEYPNGNLIGGNFIITVLKEFPNPSGIFILIESNFVIPEHS